MSRHLTPTAEQEDLLEDEDGPVNFGQGHVILSKKVARGLLDDYYRTQLQVGLDQSDRGESEPFDIEAIIAEARRRRQPAS